MKSRLSRLGKKNLLLLLGGVFLLIALPLIVLVAQRQQELRRGAAGIADETGTGAVGLSMAIYEPGNDSNPVTNLTPGNSYELFVYMEEADHEVFAAGVDISYEDRITIDAVNCESYFDGSLYSGVSGPGMVRLACYSASPFGLASRSILGVVRFTVNDPVIPGSRGFSIERANIPQGESPSAIDLAQEGVSIAFSINPLCPTCSEVTLSEILRPNGKYNIRIEWNEVANANEYKIIRGATEVATVGADIAEYTDTQGDNRGFLAGQQATYQVIPLQSGCDVSCPEYPITLPAPGECRIKNLQITPETNGLTASWEADNCARSNGIKLTRTIGEDEQIFDLNQCVSEYFDHQEALLDCGQQIIYCASCKLDGENTAGKSCSTYNTPNCPVECASDNDCYYSASGQSCGLVPDVPIAYPPQGSRCFCNNTGICDLEDIDGSDCTDQGGICGSDPCPSEEYTDLGPLDCFYDNVEPNVACCKLEAGTSPTPTATPIPGECKAVCLAMGCEGRTCRSGSCGGSEDYAENGVCSGGRSCCCYGCPVHPSPHPTATPTIKHNPSPTPTPTSRPTLPPSDCSCYNPEGQAFRNRGDSNCDGRTDILDYNTWFEIFIRNNTNYDKDKGNFNCNDLDGVPVVSIDDYEVWRQNFTF